MYGRVFRHPSSQVLVQTRIYIFLPPTCYSWTSANFPGATGSFHFSTKGSFCNPIWDCWRARPMDLHCQPIPDEAFDQVGSSEEGTVACSALPYSYRRHSGIVLCPNFPSCRTRFLHRRLRGYYCLSRHCLIDFKTSICSYSAPERSRTTSGGSSYRWKTIFKQVPHTLHGSTTLAGEDFATPEKVLYLLYSRASCCPWPRSACGNLAPPSLPPQVVLFLTRMSFHSKSTQHFDHLMQCTFKNSWKMCDPNSPWPKAPQMVDKYSHSHIHIWR